MSPTAPAEPLLCKFADGGQKKRQSHNKFVPSERGWLREGEWLVSEGSEVAPSPLCLCGLLLS